MITLTPAYGRDYKSRKAFEQDFRADKDFILNHHTSRWNGKPINRSQIIELGATEILGRYSKLRKVARIKV